MRLARWSWILLLVACQGQLSGGEVVEKKYQAPYDTHDEICNTVSNNQKVCFPTVNHHEAQYVLVIEACFPNAILDAGPGPNPRPGNTCYRVEKAVPDFTYDRYHEGDWYGSEHPVYTAPPGAGNIFKWIGLIAGGGFAMAFIVFGSFFLWVALKRRKADRKYRKLCNLPRATASFDSRRRR